MNFKHAEQSINPYITGPYVLIVQNMDTAKYSFISKVILDNLSHIPYYHVNAYFSIA